MKIRGKTFPQIEEAKRKKIVRTMSCYSCYLVQPEEEIAI